jgi:hypothetical protein
LFSRLLEENYLESDEQGYQSWLNAVDILFKEAVLFKLTIAIYFFPSKSWWAD